MADKQDGKTLARFVLAALNNFDRYKEKKMTDYERFHREHPILMRWEEFKLTVSEFFWQFHPSRNRWCSGCRYFVGNSHREIMSHRCSP